MVHDTHLRNQYGSQPASWYSKHNGEKYYVDDGRLAESEVGKWPRELREVLQDLYGFSSERIFVAAEVDGKVLRFSTPSSLSCERFFDEAAFVNEVGRARLGDSQSFDESGLGFNTVVNTCAPGLRGTRKRDAHRYLENTIGGRTNERPRRAKKRPRASSKADGMPRVTIHPKRSLNIGNSEAVYAFCWDCFRNCQQTACKIIAKAWVKAIEPKKQSTHPYTGGNDTRPDWWPKSYRLPGENTDNYMRHREPDHIGRDERVGLLCDMLRMLVEPRQRQHPAIRKVGLNLDQLEAITFEALASWFADKEKPRNIEKKQILKDLFKVARREARYRDGEIDARTEIYVMSTARANNGYTSDSDSEDGDIKREFTSASPAGRTETQVVTLPVQSNGHSQTGRFPGTDFSENIPVRAAHYSHAGFGHEMPERPGFIDTPAMSNHTPSYNHNHLGMSEMYPSPQSASRRPSVFSSPSEYPSPAGAVMFSPWPASTGQSDQAMYSFPPQAPNIQGFGAQMAQGSPYVGSAIDGLSRRPDVHHSDVFAPRGVDVSAMQHQSGYLGYVAEETSMVGTGVKAERGHCPSIPH